MLKHLNKCLVILLVAGTVFCNTTREVRADNDYQMVDFTDNVPKTLQDLKMDFDVVVYDAETKRAISTTTKSIEVGIEFKNQSPLDFKYVQVSFPQVKLANARGLILDTIESNNYKIAPMKAFGSGFILVNTAPYKLVRSLKNDVYKITATVKVVILHKAGSLSDPRNITFTTEIEKVIKKDDIK